MAFRVQRDDGGGGARISLPLDLLIKAVDTGHPRRLNPKRLLCISRTSPLLEGYGGGGVIGWGIYWAPLWGEDDLLIIKDSRGDRNSKWQYGVFFG